MSHMVQVKDFHINSLSALQSACRRLGYEFRANQKTARFYGGKQAQVDHAIVVPGCGWEIGVRALGEVRNYTLEADFYGQEGKKLKEAVNKLKQMYAVELAKQVARKKGYSVTESKLPNGSIKLKVGVMA